VKNRDRLNAQDRARRAEKRAALANTHGVPE
jgi:hypothetical protein